MSDFQPMKDLKLVQVPELPSLDSFKDMLAKQRELMKAYYVPNLDEQTTKDKNDYSMRVTVAMEDEISELRGQLNWKWWKKPHPIDETELKFEITDLFFFVLTLMVTWNISAEEAYSLYLTKHEENVRRQK